jgi:hypothetical protein
MPHHFQAVLKMNLSKSNRATTTTTTVTPSPSGGGSRPNKEVVINNFSNSFPGFQQKANQVNNPNYFFTLPPKKCATHSYHSASSNAN